MIALSVASLYYLIIAMVGRIFSRMAIANLSLLYVLVYLTTMPSIAQGIYWYSGTCAYQAGIILSLFYFGMLCDHLNNRFITGKKIHFLLMILCLVIALGFNEGNTLLIISIHLLLVWHMIRNHKKITPDIWMILGTLAAFAAVMLLAPGNSARGKYFEESHNFFHSLLFTFLQTGRFGVLWATSLPLLLCSLLFVLIYNQNRDKFAVFTLPIKSIVLNAGMLVWIFFIFIFPAYWSTNILGQHRTINVACFFFLPTWLLFLNSIASLISFEKLKRVPVLNGKHFFALGLAIVFSIFITGNGHSIIADLVSGKIRKFDNEMTERETVLSQSDSTQASVYIDPLTERPAALFVLELSADSTYWVNLCQAKFYGVRSIVCRKTE